ncbi:MAG TPA: TlpA disulfide reductase family protein [Niabella sp.]|nr:TlpA disulfide reductase family protein [Niabella sp.]
MKKGVLASVAIFFSFFLHAQSFSDAGTVWLKGNVKHFKGTYFEYAQTGFFENSSSSVLVDEKGDFLHRFEIEGTQQDMFLYLNDDPITITVADGDTLAISWDEGDFRNTFSIHSNSQFRDKLLCIQLYQYFNFRKPLSALEHSIYEKTDLTGEEKFRMITDLFNQQWNALAIQANEDYDVFISAYVNLYYQYAYKLHSYGLWRRFSPQPRLDMNLVKNPEFGKVINWLEHTRLDINFFWKSVQYREFLFDYTRFAGRDIFNSFKGEMIELNAARHNYYMANAVLAIPEIRDWFITKSILLSFDRDDFIETEKVYNRFTEELTDPVLKKVLTEGYDSYVTLKPGNPAPDFTLKDAQGKEVSLSAFKGKVVYIDFWGVTCGPCISDITHYAQKLHEKYRGKEVVFVSVCIDADEKEWKAALKKYKMDDQINLLAEGGDEDPAVKKYNVTSIPHYFLIGKDGKIISNTAPGMHELLTKEGNEIDKALQ